VSEQLEREHAAMRAAIEWFLAEVARASKHSAAWPDPDETTRGGWRDIRLERTLVEGIFRDSLQGIPPRLNRNEETRIGINDLAE
jgi:hypothetical protein